MYIYLNLGIGYGTAVKRSHM